MDLPAGLFRTVAKVHFITTSQGQRRGDLQPDECLADATRNSPDNGSSNGITHERFGSSNTVEPCSSGMALFIFLMLAPGHVIVKDSATLSGMRGVL